MKSLTVVMIMFVGLMSYAATGCGADSNDSVYKRFMDSIPDTGPGLGFQTLSLAFDAEDFNDYLEGRGFESIESAGIQNTKLGWSLHPHFQLVIGLYNGTSGFKDTYVDGNYNEVELSLSGGSVSAFYRNWFGNKKWQYRLGGGVAGLRADLRMESTPEYGATHIERYRGDTGALILEGGLQYNFNPLLGLGLVMGSLLTNVEEMERGGESVDDFPEIKLSGLYLGFGLNFHL